MRIEIGAFDAKTKLSQLLQRVKEGQCYTITVRGQPVADLVPSESAQAQGKKRAVEQMRKMQKLKGVSGQMIAEWIVEGRR